jgi:hypothetical protein
MTVQVDTERVWRVMRLQPYGAIVAAAINRFTPQESNREKAILGATINSETVASRHYHRKPFETSFTVESRLRALAGAFTRSKRTFERNSFIEWCETSNMPSRIGEDSSLLGGKTEDTVWRIRQVLSKVLGSGVLSNGEKLSVDR